MQLFADAGDFIEAGFVQGPAGLIEQARNALFVVDAAHRFADQWRDGDAPDVGAFAYFFGGRDEIGDHHRFELGVLDARDRAARQHAMGGIGANFLGALLDQRLGGVADRAAGIDDVVDQDADAPSTSPMMFITSDSPARSRRLSTMARSAPSRLASARARTTPPTSGETTIRWSPVPR